MSTAQDILATGLFDTDWYTRHYPDVTAAGIKPVEHYARFGQQEGRAPNAYFDDAFYLSHAGNIHGLMPLLHYSRVGESLNMAPGPHFEPEWYRHANRLPRSSSALAHFLRNRSSAQLAPSRLLYIQSRCRPYAAAPPDSDVFDLILREMSSGNHMVTEAQLIAESGLFDANYYLINGADVHEASVDPIEHFCTYGWHEGRQPNIYFNTAWYIITNPEIERLSINPLVHYILEGERNGRRPIVYFDPGWYRARYDISPTQLALSHFLEHRRTQKFSPNSYFDPISYSQGAGRRIAPGRDPFAHYLQVATYSDVPAAANVNSHLCLHRKTGRRSRHFP